MRWESSESSPFSDHFCVDNLANDGQPAFDHGAKHYDPDDPDDHDDPDDPDPGLGSTSCAEL